jgi:hypothetical protein
MAGNVTLPEDSQQHAIAPDQLLAETGGAHGAAEMDHGLQPVQPDDAAAAHMPAMEMPTEADQGHHG